MNLKSAKKLKAGDIVTLKYQGGEYKITGIDKNLTTDKKIYFWSCRYMFRHTEIDKVIKKTIAADYLGADSFSKSRMKGIV